MNLHEVHDALLHANSHPLGSAVVIPLIEGPEGLSVLFEVRASTLSIQPGEVCLPGGHIDPGEEPLDAAVREACEELLIDPAQLEVLGSLGLMAGPGAHPIHVYVVSLSGYEGTFSPCEVDRTFCLPLAWLVENPPSVHRVEYRPQFADDFPWHLVPGGESYPWHTMAGDVPFYEGTDPLLWGATARIVRSFVDAVADSRTFSDTPRP